ncbi:MULTISPECIES: DUF565 domain-containing protein [Cyanophyceae]|uniref:DUF565 domain-containing protein n=1 Tax=Cyanophyceae TaxID=3028117 RepID=UPI00016DC711|nr:MULTISPECIES: DUF565 domain-containing protein [Cyanophyceae]ACA98156.1 conserved hypothetical protein (Ycf20) [Picosynechococcus sp. PCC 7002]SMH43929.1 Protein of unknown function [Picosynechococcus sp. OG1]SMQ79595.1 Protein of unknown function [Synechococcus sp. 7002]
MQRTRLNLLLGETLGQFTSFFQNPWRKMALLAIFLLFGNFVATVFPPAIGQAMAWDPIVAIGIIFLAEVSNFLYYRQGDRQTIAQKAATNPTAPQSRLLFQLMHVFKIGLLYGLTVSAVNVGS